MSIRLLSGDADAPHRDPVRIVTPQREVVEVVRDDVVTLLVVEPVLVTPEGLGLALGELADVDVDDAPLDTALALRFDGEVWTVEPVSIDTSDVLTSPMLGAPSGIAQLGSDGLLLPSQRPPAPERAFSFVQFIPASHWQIQHALGFDPAGVLVRDVDGVLTEPDNITYPLPGVIELAFGVPVAGTVWLS